ncbi:MAG TPA: M48 family peptidase [Thiolapillus brandeum]|uniref:M48 family peptidase n=1 Tax=Thiolapillus brandeum TaxID=1076588 RepID=A0A831NW13_9GAMM|nr:M48 family peptidase [Thiolapillus brandeum]
MNNFTWIFLLVLTSGLLLEFWLLWRQARFVRRHRHQVPAVFAEKISLQQHQKAASYTLANTHLQAANLLFSVALLLAFTFGGGLNWLDARWQSTGLDKLWQGTGLLLSVLALATLLELPLSAWRTFVVEERFGFNRTTPQRFLIDQLMQLVLMLAITTPLVAGILWLMQKAGNIWWIWAWMLWMAFTLFFTWLYPTVIAPLFNKFSPLQDLSLKERLEDLLLRCGFHSNGMFVMDGSKRSSHGNAYFSGFGKNKRIVFFDTLLNSLEADEIEAVLAHELGHFKHRHIVKMMFSMAVISLAGLALLGWLMQQDWFFHGLGITNHSHAMALALFLLVIPTFTTFFTPLFSALSRKQEFEADSYAAQQSSAASLISGLVKMYRDNASTLTPDPLYSAFHHSHPPAAVRISHLSSKLK